MERLGESSKRCGADGEVEVKKKKRKSSSEAVEFLREKGQLDHSLREEELQLRKDQQSQTLVLLQQQQQINQVLLSLMEKMVEKQKKIEQFIYQFTSVRCFFISILKGCNTVFLHKQKFVHIKVFAYVLFSSSCSHGEGYITICNINTVNNQLLSLSWGSYFFHSLLRGEGRAKKRRET